MEEILRPPEDALSAGADLWILTDLERSSWTQKIDWYLNFQILRSTTHQKPEPGPELKDILARWEIESPAAPDVKCAPLMISSSDRLPNHAVLVMPFGEESSQKWVQRAYQAWKDLDSPRLRVFLPIGLDAGTFIAAWPGSEDSLARALVRELS